MAPFLLVLVAIGALFAAVKRRRSHLPARAVIVSPRKSTVIARDGAVQSVQSAELTLTPADLERLWSPKNLENLARTYWRFLTRVTLGVIRVRYGANERSVLFVGRPFTLLRFDAPEYELAPDHGTVRWRIRDGLLVARAGRGQGYLALDVRRRPAAANGNGPDGNGTGRATIRIEVEVSNFYPSIAAGFSTPAYEMTQSAVHVLVTHAFLRSLAALDLAESKIGRLSEVNGDASNAPPHPPEASPPHPPQPEPQPASVERDPTA